MGLSVVEAGIGYLEAEEVVDELGGILVVMMGERCQEFSTNEASQVRKLCFLTSASNLIFRRASVEDHNEVFMIQPAEDAGITEVFTKQAQITQVPITTVSDWHLLHEATQPIMLPQEQTKPSSNSR